MSDLSPTPAEEEFRRDSDERLGRMGVHELQSSPAAAGYVALVHLVDLDLRHLEPGSPEAWDAFERHRTWMARQYRALEIRTWERWDDPKRDEYLSRSKSEEGTIVPSEYAVGFGSKPAFPGERTAVAKAFALMVRTVKHTDGFTVPWMGQRWSIRNGAIWSEVDP